MSVSLGCVWYFYVGRQSHFDVGWPIGKLDETRIRTEEPDLVSLHCSSHLLDASLGIGNFPELCFDVFPRASLWQQAVKFVFERHDVELWSNERVRSGHSASQDPMIGIVSSVT